MYSYYHCKNDVELINCRICSSTDNVRYFTFKSEFPSTLDWKVKTLEPLCVSALAYQSGLACCLQKGSLHQETVRKETGVINSLILDLTAY